MPRLSCGNGSWTFTSLACERPPRPPGPADAGSLGANVSAIAALRLEPVTRENVRAACLLRLRPGQEDLVAPVAFSLAEAYVSPEIAWPRLIYDGDQLVGFVMVAFDPKNPSELLHAYLWRLNVDADHQGGGYGRFAVEEVCAEALRRG